jgi:hypothetical protein
MPDINTQSQVLGQNQGRNPVFSEKPGFYHTRKLVRGCLRFRHPFSSFLRWSAHKDSRRIQSRRLLRVFFFGSPVIGSGGAD